MSLCECDFDGETPGFFNDHFQKSRKVHRCDDCGGHILPGKKYHRIAIKWNGKIETFKLCQGCDSLRELFRCAPLGDLRQAVFDELDEVGDVPFATLDKAGTLKLAEFIDAWEAANPRKAAA